MEETEVPARSPNDISGQIQAMMDLQPARQKIRRPPSTPGTFCSSSAARLTAWKKSSRKRLREATIGFAAAAAQPRRRTPPRWTQARTRDFIEFGFEPEFIGRLPVRVVCHPLDVDDLFTILKTSEGSIIRQYEQTFAAYGIEVLFRGRRPAAHRRTGRARKPPARAG